uniref:Protein kinase domain-containing protein n=1 Tax=Mycena chlorophos TaxID=658473 RepID=A0ABQ0LDM1_MYCCL|nr:predicted protein [Mycena chlorophos]
MESTSPMHSTSFLAYVEERRRLKVERFSDEHWWVNHQPLFFSRGYLLRRRYHVDWVPSWDSSEDIQSDIWAEDGYHGHPPHVLDATRISDGAKVVFKRVLTSKPELGIHRYLNPPSLQAHPHNRTVPLLDIIPIPDDDDVVILVVPLLRIFDSPIFRHFREVVECLRQFLQGLVWMHANTIAHGDACHRNLMMDASRVVPDGTHFFKRRRQKDNILLPFRWRDRCSVAPVNYYFIDFGLSGYYPGGQESAVKTGTYGQDASVPEFAVKQVHNPFKVDVYQLGNAFIHALAPFPLQKDYLAPLLDSMTMDDPRQRPSAAEALRHFEILSAGVPVEKLEATMEYDPDTSSESDLEHEIVTG